jgi:hypothetical protein
MVAETDEGAALVDNHRRTEAPSQFSIAICLCADESARPRCGAAGAVLGSSRWRPFLRQQGRLTKARQDLVDMLNVHGER